MIDRDEARTALVEAIAALWENSWEDGGLVPYREMAAMALAVVESARPPCATCEGRGELTEIQGPGLEVPIAPCTDCGGHLPDTAGSGLGPLPYIDIMRGYESRTIGHRCPRMSEHKSGGCKCRPLLPDPCDDCYNLESISRRFPRPSGGVSSPGDPTP